MVSLVSITIQHICVWDGGEIGESWAGNEVGWDMMCCIACVEARVILDRGHLSGLG